MSRPRSSRAKRATQLGLAVLAVTALAMVPYRPVIVRGEPAPRGPYARIAPVPGLRLHVFNTGHNRMSSLLVGDHPPERPAPAFVVEHPTRGLIVFDTGLSRAVAEHGESALPIPTRWVMSSRGRVDRLLDVQMREAGLSPERVRWVVISHEHEDHTGRIAAFPNAVVLSRIGARGHRAIDFSSRGFAPFDRALDLFGDGSVVLLDGAGHTSHDVMMRLALPGGPALLAGDAVVHLDWLRGDDVQRIASDPEGAARVRNRVRAALREDPTLVLVPGHDLRGLPTGRADFVLHHPEWFTR